MREQVEKSKYRLLRKWGVIFCLRCTRKFYKINSNHKYCGSYKKMTGCSYIHWIEQRRLIDKNYRESEHGRMMRSKFRERNADKCRIYVKRTYEKLKRERPEVFYARQKKKRESPQRKAYMKEYRLKWLAKNPDYYENYKKVNPPR